MKKLKTLCLAITVIVCTAFTTKAQKFSAPIEGFSAKKTTYITMDDGTEITGRLRGYKIKKGLIEEIKIRDEADVKIRIKPETISTMYIPQSNLAKIATLKDASTDLTKIRDGKLNQAYLNDGYAYMEKSLVQIKKKQGSYMMQLVNPTFSGKIKVYSDPNASETMSVGIGGMTLAGGLDKSYYIKKSTEDAAVQIRKKDYKEQFNEIFAECPSLIEKYGDDPSWYEFEKLIYEYSVDCSN